MRTYGSITLVACSTLLASCAARPVPECTDTSQCAVGLCLPTQTCASRCSATSQCGPGEKCSTAGGCVAATGCATDADCGASGMVCALRTAACVAHCATAGCPAGQTCGAGGLCSGSTFRDAGPSSCGGQLFEASRLEANFLVVLDHSGSMADFAGSASKWEAATSAVRRVSSTHEAEIRFGLQTFSKASVRCAPVDTTVPIAPMQAAAIAAALPPTADGSRTPLGAALEIARANTGLADGSRSNNILLVTDGMENCGGDPVAEVTQAFSGRVKTYVVGFGAEVDATMLSEMATAGGTARAGASKYYQADDPAELDAALAAVARGALGCDVVLAQAPPDPKKLFVYVDGVLQPEDPAGLDGWSFDPTSRRLTLAGPSCDRLSRSATAKLNVVYGCPDSSLIEGGGGAPCTRNTDCLSGVCSAGLCEGNGGGSGGGGGPDAGGGGGGGGGAPGDACTEPSDCASLICESSTCGEPREDGAPCSHARQCASGTCDVGACGPSLN